MDLFVLDNGTNVVFEKRPASQVVAIQLWVKIGSKYEKDDNAGITHFIEHLIFKGSEGLSPNAIALRIESLGGSINAFTSYDNTVYYAMVPKESFKEALYLLTNAVFSPLFPEDEIEKERQVVLEEIKMGEDDPGRKLYKELFSLSYGHHPYGRPIIGFPETLSRLSRNEIISYFDEHYSPENVTVVIVGDLEKKEVEEEVKKSLGKLKKREKARSYEKAVFFPVEEKIRIIDRDVLESYCAISYPTPPINHKDIASLMLISALLTEGESSRLLAELKNKKGVITDASSFVFAPLEDGLFVLSVNFHGKDYKTVLDEVEREIERLNNIDEWELKKAKNQVKASYIYGMETVEGRARMLGHYYTLTGDISFVEKLLEEIDNIKPENIYETLKKYFRKDAKKVVFILPKGEKRASNPYFGELSNGLKYVINENRSAPLFSFTVAFFGGVKDEPKGKNGLFNVLSRMLLKGTKKRTAFEIARTIDFLAGEITPFVGYNTFGLSGKFMSKDLDQAIDLLREILLDPLFSEEELRKVQAEVLSQLRQINDDPVSYIFKRFNAFFYEGHPYERDPYGSEQDVINMKVEDLKRAYLEHVSPKNCVISISGDVKISNTKELIERMFSGWDGPKKEVKSDIVPTKSGEAYLEKDLLQNHMIIGFPGVSLRDEERFAVEVMDAIFSGMAGRIHTILREKNPFAYATAFFNRMGYDSGIIGIYAAFDPKTQNDVIETIEKEIRTVQESSFTDEEVERAKKYLLGSFKIAMQSNKNIAYRMALDTLYGLGPEFFKKWPEKIIAVKKEDVREVAKKYLVLEKSARVVIGKKPNF